MAAGAAAPDQNPGAAAPAAPSPSPAAGAAADPLDSPADPQEPATRQTILVVEDEPGPAACAADQPPGPRLRSRDRAGLACPALEQATQRKPDVVILDLGLPDIDGMDLIRELRLVTSAPIIVLSGRTGPGDKIGALDAGADDYVTKPFSMEELLARLRAALRRDGPVPPERPVAIGRSTVDLAAHLATRDGQQVRLTPTEWRLLEILIRHPGQLVGGRRMLTEVWGPAYQQSTHYLRFHMAGLRRKLEDDPARPRHLLTEPGMGYRFSP